MLSVHGFEGPLDWLLELARARRIDLARLSILALVDAFVAALDAARAGADPSPTILARWADWLLMAAELALLRSRLMLPYNSMGAAAAREAAEVLRHRLLSHAAVAAAADWLEQREQVGQDVFTRGRPEQAVAARAARTVDVTALLRACLAAIRLPAEAEQLYSIAALPGWSVRTASARIEALLPEVGERGAPLGTFLPGLQANLPDPERWCRSAVASTFVAALELARTGTVALQQDTTWASVQVTAGEGLMLNEAAEQQGGKGI